MTEQNTGTDVTLKEAPITEPEEGDREEMRIDKVATLIKSEEYGQLLSIIDKVPFIDQKWLVDQALASGKADDVAFNLANLNKVDKTEVALKAIDAGAGDHVAFSLRGLEGIDQNKVTRKLFETPEGRSSIYSNIKDIKGLDSDTALEMIKTKNENLIYQNLDSFDVMDERATEAFANAYLSYVPADYPEKFTITPAIEEKLEKRYPGRLAQGRAKAKKGSEKAA